MKRYTTQPNILHKFLNRNATHRKINIENVTIRQKRVVAACETLSRQILLSVHWSRPSAWTKVSKSRVVVKVE